MDGMLRISVKSLDDGTELKFALHADSTFGYLKEATATHLMTDLTAIQLYVEGVLICVPDDLPVSKFLNTGDVLQIKDSSVQSSISKEPVSSLNGGYSEEEALQLALSQDFGGNSSQSSSWPHATNNHDILDGQTICTGETSQYSSGKGSSACTSICLVAACRLLNSHLPSTRPSDLDEIVHEGTRRHNEIGADHTGVDDLWGLPQFVDIQDSLELHECLQGHLLPSSPSNKYLELFQRVLEMGVSESNVAIVLTKSPETVLCLFTSSGVYLFDSHGEVHEKKKRVYLKHFSSMSSLATALLQKYPPQEFGVEGSMLSEMYNTFEVYPLTRGNSGAPRIDTTLSHQEGDGGFEDTAIQDAIRLSLLNSENENHRCFGTVFADEATPAAPAIEQAHGTSTSQVTTPLSPVSIDSTGLFERDDYEDPISKEIMADPVKCADGYTYERRNIERHFRTQIEAEEERQAAEGQGNQPDREADTTCCGVRRRIDLTSPITGAIISDALLPDRNLERIIVRLVEHNTLGMTEEDIQEWNKLREEKRVQDRIREDELRAARANELRMEDQAAQAEERRRAERLDPTAAGEAVWEDELMRAAQVRVDRNIRIVTEKLGENDLGLSVCLCEHGERIFPDYIMASSQQVRCMVACCAAPVDPDRPTWCGRCGRIVCQECQNFGVTDISAPDKTTLHSICSECVSQVLERMDLSDLLSRQTRDIIRVMYLQRHSARLQNAAAVAQDHIVHHETNAAYQPRLEALHSEIEALQRQRGTLQQQIERAQHSAQRVREDEGVDDDASAEDSSTNQSSPRQVEIEVLRQRCNDLEEEFALVSEADVPDEEEMQIQFVVRREQKGLELEQARMRLAEASSELTGTTAANSCKASDSSLEVLQRQYHSLVATRPPDDDEEAQMQYFVNLSELTSRVERAQITSTEAASMQETPSGAGTVASEAGEPRALSLLLTAIEQQSRRRFRRKTRQSDVQRLRELIAEINQIEQEGQVYRAVYRQRLRELSEALDKLPRQCSKVIASEIREARAVLTQKDQESTAMTADPFQELLRLQMIEVSSLSEEEQIEHVMRMSHLQESMRKLEEVLLSNSEETNSSNSSTGKCSATQSPRQQPSEDTSEGSQADPGHHNEANTKTPTSVGASILSLSESRADTDKAAAVPTSSESTVGLTSLIRGVGGLVMHYFGSPSVPQPDVSRIDLDECRARLEAIGRRETEWQLPLGLEYPTQSMEEQLEILRNSLELRLVDSQRHWDQELSRAEQSLVEEVHELENAVQNLTAEASNAEASVREARAQLRERRRQRALEQQRQEERRRQEELRRQEQERRAQAEAEALQQRHEEQTRQAFAAARGGRDRAGAFGGRGDLRMCGRCKAGPFENQACSDLAAHNGSSRANHCPNCNWFEPNWHAWPYFDGIYGPH